MTNVRKTARDHFNAQTIASPYFHPPKLTRLFSESDLVDTLENLSDGVVLFGNIDSPLQRGLVPDMAAHVFNRPVKVKVIDGNNLVIRTYEADSTLHGGELLKPEIHVLMKKPVNSGDYKYYIDAGDGRGFKEVTPSRQQHPLMEAIYKSQYPQGDSAGLDALLRKAANDMIRDANQLRNFMGRADSAFDLDAVARNILTSDIFDEGGEMLPRLAADNFNLKINIAKLNEGVDLGRLEFHESMQGVPIRGDAVNIVVQKQADESIKYWVMRDGDTAGTGGRGWFFTGCPSREIWSAN